MSDEAYGWQDDVLIQLGDQGTIAWESLYSLPPWRAVLVARAINRIAPNVITDFQVQALVDEARKTGGSGKLPHLSVRLGPEKLVAMHGDFGSGKDTVAQRLVEEHGYTRLAFADQLKKLCEILDPVVSYRIDTQLGEAIAAFARGADAVKPSVNPVRLTEVIGKIGWDEAKKRYPETRRVQQVFATEVIREHVAANYWVDVVEKQIEDGGKYVITDLRFPNEWEMVDRLGGQVWWIQRPGFDYGADGKAKTHVSEQFHPPRYCLLINDHDVEELWAKVDIGATGGGHAAMELLA